MKKKNQSSELECGDFVFTKLIFWYFMTAYLIILYFNFGRYSTLDWKLHASSNISRRTRHPY